jgi:hypothetical protein
MTADANRDDLAQHAREMDDHEPFNDALSDRDARPRLDASVLARIGRGWPLEDPRHVGRALNWREWIDLRDLPGG